MSAKTRGVCLLGALVLSEFVCARDAWAKDFFLTIGGGYDPAANPASIERDVNLANGVVADRLGDGAKREVYFADGDDPQRDVVYVDPAHKSCPPAVKMMAELFGEPDAVDNQFRDHKVRDVAGPADRDVLSRRFKQLGRELKAGDRLIVYVAGHGGDAIDRTQPTAEPAPPKTPSTKPDRDAPPASEQGADSADARGKPEKPFNHFDTSLFLWNSQELTATEFCHWLDQLSPEVKVVLLMGQCYSGGFSHAMFQRDDAALGLSPALRCGFFSQLHDRASAGCAAQADDPRLEEYFTFFWSALGGKAPAGHPAPADCNHDGAISLAEAHAYAVVECQSIDVPLRTSEELLRIYSRLGGSFELEPDADQPPGGGDKKAPPAAAEDTGDLMQPTGPIAAIAAKATPDQRAILDGIPAKLSGIHVRTVEDVRVELEAAEDRLAEAQEAFDAAASATDQALADAQGDVYQQWPELYFTYTPASAELMTSRAKEFTAHVEKLGSYSALLAARKHEGELADDLETAESAVARLERLLRTIENVVLAENLDKAAPADVVKRFHAIREMEEQGFGPATQAAAAATASR